MRQGGTATHPRLPAVRCADCGQVRAGQVRVSPRTLQQDGAYIDSHRSPETGRRCLGDRRHDHEVLPAEAAR